MKDAQEALRPQTAAVEQSDYGSGITPDIPFGTARTGGLFYTRPGKLSTDRITFAA